MVDNNLIDFHVHIDYYENFNEIYNYYVENRIYALFVTNLPQIFEKAQSSFYESKYVKIALGYHPEMVQYKKFDKEMFDKNILRTKYIGEVGLDFSKNFRQYKYEQIDIFKYICCQSGKHNRLLSVHSRNAEEDSVEILTTNNVQFAVFHWYTGGTKVLKKIIDSGYYLSINPSMLSTQKGINIMRSVPTERILVESDGPYGKFQKKVFKPENLETIYKEFEKVLGIKDFKSVVFNNMKSLLSRQIEYINK